MGRTRCTYWGGLGLTAKAGLVYLLLAVLSPDESGLTSVCLQWLSASL